MGLMGMDSSLRKVAQSSRGADEATALPQQGDFEAWLDVRFQQLREHQSDPRPAGLHG